MQLSGVTVRWTLRAGAPDLIDIRVSGQPLQVDQTYTVATNSYIAGQWSYNLGFRPENVVRTDKTVYQAAVGRVEGGAITPPADLRMIEVK